MVGLPQRQSSSQTVHLNLYHLVQLQEEKLLFKVFLITGENCSWKHSP